MTRLFREGRTETVRSCTIETSAFVKAMEAGVSNFKAGSNPSHFSFEIDVGKRRIRHRTTRNLNKFMSDPSLSDIDFKTGMAWV